MTTKKNFVFAFISLFAMLLTALGISFAFPSQKADSAIDWTGHSYTKFTPYSTTDGVYLSPIEDNARLGFVVVLVGGYSLIGGSYNGFMTTSAGATCGIDGTTYKGAQHQGTNTNYYDIRYRIEAYAQSNVYIRQARVAAKNASGFYALYTDTDYGINSTTTSFKYGQTIDRDDTFGTVEGSGAYDINMLYDLVLVYEYFINGNSVRVSAGSVADELAGGLGAATTVNPADYERDGYALEGFWTGENKTGTQVLDADGYFVNDYAYTPGATLYPGYTNIIYWTDETAWSSAGQDFNNYSWQGSGTEEDPYLIQTEWDLAYLSWTIYNDQVYGGSSNKVTEGIVNYFYPNVYFRQTNDLDFSQYYWQPIGIYYTRDGGTAYRLFSGNYDGGNYTVSGVYTPEVPTNPTNMQQQAYRCQGLFGLVGGTLSITNIGIVDSLVQGYACVGGIVAGMYHATLTMINVYNTGDVIGVEGGIGGIVGGGYGGYSQPSFSELTIINAYNTGSISGGSDYDCDVGGIVGESSAYESHVYNAYNTGNITGGCVGGIMGLGCWIENSWNSGEISGSSAGGIAGVGIAKKCYNTGKVTGTYSAGGILSSAEEYHQAQTIFCYNLGDVFGSIAGGIAADMSTTTLVLNCYNLGNVNLIEVHINSAAGGIVATPGASTEVRNCFNLGQVDQINGDHGAVVGRLDYEVVISNNYYGGACEASVGGINGADVAGQAQYLENIDSLAKLEEWYSADAVLEDGTLVWNEEYPWDFENVWAIYGEMVNEGYPVFIRYWTDIYYTFDNYVFSGAGTQADPYLIETPQQLAYLSWTIYSGSAHNGQSITINGENYYYQNSCFRQTANIDLSAGYWQPIGIFSTRESSEIVNRYFAGNYDGNGYIITGINIPEDTEYSYQGLFGVVKGNITDASVTNVAIYNSNIHGLEYVGGIAGYVGANASVTNSFYQGGIYGSSSGGIVGQVEGGEVSSSGFEGDVSAGVSAIAGVISNGGLVDSSYGIAEAPAQSGIAMYGQIDGGTIQNSLSICYDGDVTSKNYIGSDFSEFVWLNTDSSPIPRSLTWIGSIWPGSVTVDMLSSSGWTEIVA